MARIAMIMRAGEAGGQAACRVAAPSWVYGVGGAGLGVRPRHCVVPFGNHWAISFEGVLVWDAMLTNGRMSTLESAGSAMIAGQVKPGGWEDVQAGWGFATVNWFWGCRASRCGSL